MKIGEHSENTRVKMPAIVQFTRIGYEYLSIKPKFIENCWVYPHEIDPDTNIFKDIFKTCINRINNTNFNDDEINKLIDEIKLQLSNDDLGKKFYDSLLNGINGIKLIEFNSEKIDNNGFNVVTELTFKNGEDEFRPDVIPLLNGMPLFFVEVKKPNNREGIIAERDRINTRFKNQKFKRFINMMQLLVFSNNNEYDDNSPEPIQGAYYCTSSTTKAFFNHFREQKTEIYNNVKSIDENKEEIILRDNGYISIKGTPEYNTNLNPQTPTNRIITSLFFKERLLKLIKYGIVYVDEKDRNDITHREKHIMRYPQFFATLEIEKKLNEGKKRGIIWHTQGSGKTELAYYNVKYLTDYFQRKNTITKFYFIVDRLYLLVQAQKAFESRGLKVNIINSKEDFIKDIKSTGGVTGETNITVINIQKFSQESITQGSDYNVNVQRIYFLDEAHRSYNPKGSFLANLMNSDRNAIMIGLTGTPIIIPEEYKDKSGNKYSSKDIFGPYIHTYYYNDSIKDGYTLRLIREEIETTYKEKLSKTVKELTTLGFNKRDVFSHEKYVKNLVKYIVDDFKMSRIRLNDNSIGGMIVCDSSLQAREIYRQLQDYSELSKALILHDEDTKETRTEEQDNFVEGKIDILVVYNMLLTGFDAHRLKKLYLGRIIKAHNLLQTLTRVNRPYKDYQYGYVVDFANIQPEFDKTNKEYFNELQKELGDNFEKYNNIFKSPEEIDKELEDIKNILWEFDTSNLEIFTNEVNELNLKELYSLRKTLTNAKELYNIVKMFGYDEIVEKIEILKINKMLSEVTNRIAIKNFTDNMMNAENTSGILNMAMEGIEFQFKKISESELKLADEFRDVLEKTATEVINNNFDKKDKEYTTLYEELQRIFKSKNIEELNAQEMTERITWLKDLLNRAKNKNSENYRIMQKYENDVKFMRIHKRVKEMNLAYSEITINTILLELKHSIDDNVSKRNAIIDNEGYFINDVITTLYHISQNNSVLIKYDDIQKIARLIVDEYIEERKQVI